MDDATVLPYRTDSVALANWLTARARGRSAEQLRSAVDSPKGVEGTAAAAVALGFTDATSGTLTGVGERYALADQDERRRILLERFRTYTPYWEALREIAERGQPLETEIRWIEALWATRGYGGSESNRREGAAAFGRLVDFVGLGEYIPGRRGRPTRIRWADEAFVAPPSASPAPPPRDARAGHEEDSEEPDLFTTAPPPPLASHPTPAALRTRPRPSPTRPGELPRKRDRAAVNRITIPLANGATARIEVPLRLPPAEKRRLLELLDRLITED